MKSGKLIVVEGDNEICKPFIECAVSRLQKEHDLIDYHPLPYVDMTIKSLEERSKAEAEVEASLAKGNCVIINEGHLLTHIKSTFCRIYSMIKPDFDRTFAGYLMHDSKHDTDLGKDYIRKFEEKHAHQIEETKLDIIRKFIQHNYSTHEGSSKLHLPAKKIYLVTNHDEMELLKTINRALTHPVKIAHPEFDIIECQKEDYRHGKYDCISLEHRLIPKEEICTQLHDKLKHVIPHEHKKIQYESVTHAKAHSSSEKVKA